MSDAKMVTEREAVDRERKAFADGASWARNRVTGPTIAEAEDVARIAFPMPKVTRPRVYTDHTGDSFRVVDGHLEVCYRLGEWFRHDNPTVFLQDADEIKKLFQCPTEEADA